MSRTDSRLWFAAIAIIGICILAAITSQEKTGRATQYYGDAESIGTDEDADARAQYELQRLQDPATGKIPAYIRQKEIAFAATLPNDNSTMLGRSTSTLTWQHRGPWNVGGRTRAFAIDISNTNTLISGSCSGGMWRSTDGGTTWTNTTPTLLSQAFSCVAQDNRSGHTSTWYCGTGEAYGASASASGAFYRGNGIYKSTDGGATWNVLTATSGATLSIYDHWGDYIWNIVTDPATTSADVVYASAVGGIYRSSDGGTTWTLVKGAGDSYFTDVAITSRGVVYATLSSDGGQRGIFRSTDGVAWTAITPDSFPTTYNRLKIGISPSHEEQVYILGNTPGFGQPDTSYGGQVEWNSLWRYTYKSGDGSDTNGVWENRSANLPTTGGPFDKYTCQGSYDIVVKVKPDDTATLFIGGTNLYRSTTAFKDATHTTFIGGYRQGATLPVVELYTNHHPDQHELCFLPGDPSKMISANDGGIFKTDNNLASTVSWTPLNNGYLTSMFYTCAIDHAGTNDIIIGGAQDNGSWYTNSASVTAPWVSPRGGDGSYCAIADGGSAYYFSIQNGKMMRAKLNSSGGVDSFARIDPIGAGAYQFINPFILDPNDNNIMYMTAGRSVWRNNNLAGIPYAGNWDSIRTNWTRLTDTVTGISLSTVAVSKTPANRLYIGTTVRKVYRMDNAHTGMPTKRDITPTSTAVSFPGAYVSCIAVDPDDADKVMVVFSNYSIYSLFYSADGGTTWSKVAGNLEQSPTGAGDGPSCRWASIMPVAGGTVYLVGTSTGLFATTELRGDSTVWVKQGTNTIGNAVVDMIDYRRTDGLVVVATHSYGMFSTHITSVADINTVTTLNNSNQPSANIYPNPVLDRAILNVTTTTSDLASLNIADINGRIVYQMPGVMLKAGENNLPLEVASLPHGSYYCTLSGTRSKVSCTLVKL